jgi:hypothetical protein
MNEARLHPLSHVLMLVLMQLVCGRHNTSLRDAFQPSNIRNYGSCRKTHEAKQALDFGRIQRSIIIIIIIITDR